MAVTGIIYNFTAAKICAFVGLSKINPIFFSLFAA
jgi:hypothetical protein